jgi:hypothetical protein
LGVALNSLVNGIAASPEGEGASGMNSCLLIGGVLDAPAIGPHRGYQLVIVLFDLRQRPRTAQAQKKICELIQRCGRERLSNIGGLGPNLDPILAGNAGALPGRCALAATRNSEAGELD